MKLFLNPNPESPTLTSQELKCLINDNWWHCTTIEFKNFLTLIIFVAKVAVIIIARQNRLKEVGFYANILQRYHE